MADSILLRKVAVIANPVSGRGRSLRVLASVEHLLRSRGISFKTFKTTKPGDAEGFSSDLTGFDAVFVISGDGTVNEVINGMIDRPIPILVIPVGTGNVIAKELRLDNGIGCVNHVIESNSTRMLDLGLCEGKRFLSMLSAGFDASVVHDFHNMRKGTTQHIAQYFPFAMRTLLKHRYEPISIVADGKVLTKSATFVQICNVGCYGGPFSFAPAAAADDGLLDVVWFNPRTAIDVSRIFWSAFLRRPGCFHDCFTVRARTVSMSSDGRVFTQMDGEPLGTLPCEASLRHACMPFLVKT